MKNAASQTVLSALVFFFAAGAASAQLAPVNFDARIDASSILKGMRLAVREIPAVEGVSSTPAPALVQKQASSVSAKKTVRVSGWLRLEGSNYIGRRDGFVHMNLSGSVRLDIDGDYRTDTLWVRENFTIFVRRGTSHISEYVHIWERVNIYDKNGRYVGSTMVSGSIWVSGWKSGGWLRLSGSGNISGSFSID